MNTMLESPAVLTHFCKMQRDGGLPWIPNGLMEAAPFKLIAVVIRKANLGQQYHAPEILTQIALEFGLERLFNYLEELGQAINFCTS